MCGIAGQLLREPRIPSEYDLATMAAAMRYRGPDDVGLYRSTHIGLVHRRLSIRDLSIAGRCPMPNADGCIRVLLNGEIYNWRELRIELEANGQIFKTQSDTEVIVNGYAVWGKELISKLQGMFAIAIWDAKQECLLLARDRFGEKPLFYRTNANGLDFSSSIEALASIHPDRAIDPIAIACHLIHGFIPAALTVWKECQVLPPAHLLLLTVKQGMKLEKYWEFPTKCRGRKGLQASFDEMEAAIEDSVVRCLDADVPVGVFLSGGVDSSLIAAMAARHRPSLPAFSLGFCERDFSELPYAQRVAAHLGLPHHVIEVGAKEVLACLPHLIKQYGQPFGDASAVPTYLVSQLARTHVKVCLSGDGGDESFGGYWRTQSGVYAARYGALVPKRIREQWVPSVANKLGGFGRRWLAMNQLSLAAPGAGYTNSQSWLNMLDDIAGSQLKAAIETDLVSFRVGKSLEWPKASILQRLLYDDFQVQLPDDYLTKVDVASMAASLEVRAPYLCQRVVEGAWALPDSMKLHWGQRKWLLKRIAARWVPPEVVYRRKMGFAMPIEHWWRGELGDYLIKLMEGSVAVSEGWIQRATVLRLLKEHRHSGNHATRLWLVLWLELWFRLVVKGVSPEALRSI